MIAKVPIASPISIPKPFSRTATPVVTTVVIAFFQVIIMEVEGGCSSFEKDTNLQDVVTRLIAEAMIVGNLCNLRKL